MSVLRLVGNIVSAKFIDPAAYGMMSVVNILIQGLQMTSDVGIEQGVIYDEKGGEPQFLKTAYSLQIIRGLVMALGGLLLTYPISYLIDMRLIYLLPIVSLQCLLYGFTSINLAYNRRMVTNLHQVAWVDMGSQIAAFTILISFSWWMRSVWALAMSAVALGVMRTTLSFTILSGPKAGVAWDIDIVKRIIRYGRWIFVSTFVTYLSLRFDIFTLGVIAGVETLGVYNMGLLFTSTLNILVFQITQTILFPALTEANRSNNREALRQTFETSRKLILPVALWGITALSYCAPIILDTFYRDAFSDASWMLQCQVTFVWFVMLTDSWVRALMAIGDTRNMAICNIVRLIFGIIFTMSGFYLFGMVGFIFGMTLACICAHGWVHYALHKHNLTALRLDVIYTLVAIPLLLGGTYGPKFLHSLTDWNPTFCSFVLALIVGLPFTAGLAVYLRGAVKAARGPSKSVDGELSSTSPA